MEKGLIHIYCGNGKGKTTAALGLAVRAAGSGMRVHIVQMIKGNPTSELSSLEQIPNISVSRPHRNFGFTSSMSEDDKAQLTEIHNSLLDEASEKMNSGEIEMLIVDEFFAAYNKGIVSRERADRIVFEKSEQCELVLTGRDPDARFISCADYVSEINCVKHPYEHGIKARKGIEF